MLKSRKFKRKAVCLGLTATLIAGFAVTFVVPTAANICRELNMAGISLSLDKFSSNNKDSIINSSVSQPAETATESAVSASPEASAETTAEPAKEEKKKKAPKNNGQPKRVDKGLVTDMSVKAISTASDYVHVRRKPNTHSKIVGRLYKGCSADVLKTKNGWAKIRSGNVTGYIKKSYLAIGKDAKKMIGKYGQKYVRVKTTVVTLNVRKKADIKSKIITQIPIEENYDVLKSTDHWYKIEIDGDTKGYVRKEYVTLHVRFKHAKSMAEIKAERRRKRAAKRAERQRLAALAASRASRSTGTTSSSSSSSSRSSRSSRTTTRRSYSTRRSSSSSSGSSSSSRSSSSSSSNSSASVSASGSTGSDIASYAQKFVGNPYRWGGTSLTGGADCSGFTMRIYAQYGYSLPHSSGSQAGCGRSVSLSNVQPGDLIFYKHGGSIGHVAMYIGGGRVVHAKGRQYGITTDSMYYNQPACARRIVG